MRSPLFHFCNIVHLVVCRRALVECIVQIVSSSRRPRGNPDGIACTIRYTDGGRVYHPCTGGFIAIPILTAPRDQEIVCAGT